MVAAAENQRELVRHKQVCGQGLRLRVLLGRGEDRVNSYFQGVLNHVGDNAGQKGEPTFKLGLVLTSISQTLKSSSIM